MQEKYKVIEIFERDYGCEERAEGQTDMVQVRLCSESEKSVSLRQRTQLCTERRSQRGQKCFSLTVS